MPKGTQMEINTHNFILISGQAKFKKSIPLNSMSNVPIIYMAALLRAYSAFATTFKALEANFFR
jgi:hypothetical protein